MRGAAGGSNNSPDGSQALGLLASQLGNEALGCIGRWVGQHLF